MPRGGIEDKKVIAHRIALAHREKRKTRGDILRDGLLGPDDKRGERGEQRKDQKARPILKVDKLKDTSKVIQGRPRTGRTNWNRPKHS